MRRRNGPTCLLLWLAVLMTVPAPNSRADVLRFSAHEFADRTTCQLIESAARVSGVPIGLLTRLVWTESRFRPDATSPAGAQGIAQFMPQTAAARGLADPFDPEQAIPKAAGLLADLALRFGNFGLAAAAYNAGPAKVAAWLAQADSLPPETRDFVYALTGRSVEDWSAGRRGIASLEPPAEGRSCLEITVAFRAREGSGGRFALPAPSLRAPENFLQAAALVSFERARRRYCRGLGAVPHEAVLPNAAGAPPGVVRGGKIQQMPPPPLCGG